MDRLGFLEKKKKKSSQWPLQWRRLCQWGGWINRQYNQQSLRVVIWIRRREFRTKLQSFFLQDVDESSETIIKQSASEVTAVQAGHSALVNHRLMRSVKTLDPDFPLRRGVRELSDLLDVSIWWTSKHRKVFFFKPCQVIQVADQYTVILIKL